ncbi:ran-binding protein M homolog [Rutidosis leptorrhynchoides]|uniref:ran-binding protein M homolog n=1 Tax=Rutidosis leptorrhynchoides TaxID=125765 RepID=UPI003A9A096F
MTEVEENQDLVGSYFMELWRIKSKRREATSLDENDVVEMMNLDKKEEDLLLDLYSDEPELEPSELDTLKSSSGFAIVLPDKVSVKYPRVNLHGHDVGVVQANHPAPVKRLVYYFEITVKNAGAKGQISIGFTPNDVNLNRQPGWEANTYGYHGDDGLLYRGQGRGEAFGPTYTVGDTVGAGINYALQKIFFTKNGQMVGFFIDNTVKDRLYPTVGVHSLNEEVTVNFGKTQFMFDLITYEATERAKIHAYIEKIIIPPTASYGVVRSYLQHYGYTETLEVFDQATQESVPPITGFHDNGFNEHMYKVEDRKNLRKLIKDGQINDAFGILRKLYPHIVQDDTSAICVMLYCQEFIELVRVGHLEEAVRYGRTHFQKFNSLKKYENLVQDCAALLAYQEPEKSAVGYLLEDSHRENVADAVNAMILSTNPNLQDKTSCLHSYLERLLKQLTACFLEKRLLNGDQGETFNLKRLLLSKNTQHN